MAAVEFGPECVNVPEPPRPVTAAPSDTALAGDAAAQAAQEAAKAAGEAAAAMATAAVTQAANKIGSFLDKLTR